MSDKPKLMTQEEIDKYPPHMRMDYENRNKNIRDGKELCPDCGGTGNELLSMYRQCPECDNGALYPPKIRTKLKEIRSYYEARRSIER